MFLRCLQSEAAVPTSSVIHLPVPRVLPREERIAGHSAEAVYPAAKNGKRSEMLSSNIYQFPPFRVELFHINYTRSRTYRHPALYYRQPNTGDVQLR